MDLQNVWTVATKDFSIFMKKKSIMYSVIALLLSISIGLPAVVLFAERRATIPIPALIPLLDAFAFFFVILASIIPTVMAAYSFVGEKLEKSLEPLLATPTADSEILLGKSLAAFLPSVVAIYVSAPIFMVLTDAVTAGKIGYLFFPNWTIAVVLLLAAPLACILSVELNVIISARINDIRTAEHLGGLVMLPFTGLYVLGEARFVTLDANNLLIISAVLLLVDALLFFLSRSTFRREEILTKWK